jgi:hypothetical protein
MFIQGIAGTVVDWRVFSEGLIQQKRQIRAGASAQIHDCHTWASPIHTRSWMQIHNQPGSRCLCLTWSVARHLGPDLWLEIWISQTRFALRSDMPPALHLASLMGWQFPQAPAPVEAVQCDGLVEPVLACPSTTQQIRFVVVDHCRTTQLAPPFPPPRAAKRVPQARAKSTHTPWIQRALAGDRSCRLPSLIDSGVTHPLPWATLAPPGPTWNGWRPRLAPHEWM